VGTDCDRISKKSCERSGVCELHTWRLTFCLRSKVCCSRVCCSWLSRRSRRLVSVVELGVRSVSCV